MDLSMRSRPSRTTGVPTRRVRLTLSKKGNVLSQNARSNSTIPVTIQTLENCGGDKNPPTPMHSLRGTENLDDALWHFKVIYPALCRAEDKSPHRIVSPRTLHKNDQTSEHLRTEIVDWIAQRHDEFELTPPSLFLAVQLVDRFQAQRIVPPHRILLLAAAALLVASKFEDEMPPAMGSLEHFGRGQFVVDELPLMEIAVLDIVGYRLHTPTPYHHLRWFHEINGGTGVSMADADFEFHLVEYLAELGLRSPGSSHWSPSNHAVAAVLLSNVLLRRSRLWPPALEELYKTGDGELEAAVAAIVPEICKSLHSSKPGQVFYNKHAVAGRASIAAKFARVGSDEWQVK